MQKGNLHGLLFSVFVLLIVLILLVTGAMKTDFERRVDSLWAQTVEPLLIDTPWISETSYDAANSLMLPLHYAFSKNGTASQRRQFRNMIKQLLDDTTILFDDNTLRVAQFSYLLSQYLTLADDRQYWGETEQQLYNRLLDLVEFYWFYRIRYDVTFHHKFAGLSQRVAWKARSESTTPFHNRALVDEEWFVMAISADLSGIARAEPLGKKDMLDRLMAESCSAIEKGGVFYDDGSWHFQPGVWSSHADYSFAGNSALAEDLKPSPVEDIGLDSGHAHRFPLWLKSLITGSTGQCKSMLDRAQAGFRQQFVKHVLEIPDHEMPRLRNFLDGSNGVYRYGYETLGENLGYGPYEMSSTLLNGWYVFMGGEPMYEAFSRLLEGLPFDTAKLSQWIGPSTLRPRHALFKEENYWLNGFAELHILLGLHQLDGAGANEGE